VRRIPQKQLLLSFDVALALLCLASQVEGGHTFLQSEPKRSEGNLRYLIYTATAYAATLINSIALPAISWMYIYN
jgi:hypothetical protein